MDHKTFFLALEYQRILYSTPCLPILTSFTIKISTSKINKNVRSLKGVVKAIKFVESDLTHHSIFAFYRYQINRISRPIFIW